MTSKKERPYVWQMIKEAVENLNGQVSYSDIKEYINGKWTDVYINGLQDDIQKHLIEEYIKPQLRGDDLIKEFDKLIESKECQSLEWQVLINVVGKIIENKSAFAQMCEINTLGFKESYQQHFIEKRNTFILFDCPLSSMCAEFVMRKWH